MNYLIVTFTFSLLLASCYADGDCPGSFNKLSPWSGDLVKLKEVANGSLYTAGDGDDQIYGRREIGIGNVKFIGKRQHWNRKVCMKNVLFF